MCKNWIFFPCGFATYGPGTTVEVSVLYVSGNFAVSGELSRRIRFDSVSCWVHMNRVCYKVLGQAILTYVNVCASCVGPNCLGQAHGINTLGVCLKQTTACACRYG